MRPCTTPRRRRLIAALALAWLPAAGASRVGAAAAPTPSPAVDLNTASPVQLQTLPGIGAAEARRIVAARPYLSKAELATRQVLPTGVYLSIRKLIVVRPRLPAKR